MRPLQITLFILGFLIIGTQTFRHVYVKFLEPKTSVLDPFRSEAEAGIASAETLDDLVALYEEALEEVREFEAGTSAPPSSARPIPPVDPSMTPAEIRARRQGEPYMTEARLRGEIMRWEAQSNGIRKVRFYWSFGLLGVILGLICFMRFSRWIGMAAIISGFAEMSCWTSPLMGVAGSRVEFERLLNHRLVLSLITWLLLMGFWILLERSRKAEEAGAS